MDTYFHHGEESPFEGSASALDSLERWNSSSLAALLPVSSLHAAAVPGFFDSPAVEVYSASFAFSLNAVVDEAHAGRVAVVGIPPVAIQSIDTIQ